MMIVFSAQIFGTEAYPPVVVATVEVPVDDDGINRVAFKRRLDELFAQLARQMVENAP